MADQLSPARGPLVDPDVRLENDQAAAGPSRVRQAMRKPAELLLLGESGGFERRWVKPADRVARGTRCCRNGTPGQGYAER